MKSWFTVRVTGTLCAMCELSVPVAEKLKLNVPGTALLTVKLKAAPEVVGVTVPGEALQVAGGVPVHDRLTVLAYPLIAVSVPGRLSGWLTVAERLPPLIESM